MMYRISLRIAICILLASFTFCSDDVEPSKYPINILVFTKTQGYRHESIGEGVKMLRKLCDENNIGLSHTENSLAFHPDNLARYDAVIFLSTTGEVLNNAQQAAFENFIRLGKGFVGIHSAAGTEYDWSWYGKLLGAFFESHSDPQTAKVVVVDKSHLSTHTLPSDWDHFDEWYNFNYEPDNKKVLAVLDETTYYGGTHIGYHPISWYNEFDGGRSFYTGLGHTYECYSDSLFIAHIWGGVKYAIGTEKF